MDDSIPIGAEWRQIGLIGVDSGQVVLIDPAYLPDADLDDATDAILEGENTTEVSVGNGLPLGVLMVPGWGDGFYPVFGRFCKQGLAEMRVIFLTTKGEMLPPEMCRMPTTDK